MVTACGTEGSAATRGRRSSLNDVRKNFGFAREISHANTQPRGSLTKHRDVGWQNQRRRCLP
jgi:hypothetical protein